MKSKEILSLQDHLDSLKNQFMEAGDPAKVESMSAYMKNKFEFAGLQKPVREVIVKPWMKSISGLNWKEQEKASKWLWNQDEREFQYVAMELLFRNKKQWQENSLQLFEKLLLIKSWWDTVDYLASSIIGFYFIQFPSAKESKVNEWIQSDNMWLNRTAMIFQLKYREKLDTTILFNAIIPHLNSSEFFIQKAIGWSLRQLSITQPTLVRKFLRDHDLKPLSKREAIRHLQL